MLFRRINARYSRLVIARRHSRRGNLYRSFSKYEWIRYRLPRRYAPRNDGKYMRFFLTLILFLVWTGLKVYGVFIGVDKWVYGVLLQVPTVDVYKWFWMAITFLGEWYVVIGMGCYVSFHLIKRFGMQGLLMTIGLIPLFFVNTGIKMTLQLVRPIGYFSEYAQPTTFTYPSGHSSSAVLIFFLFPWLLSLAQNKDRPAFWLSLVFTLLVASSRIFMGVHWLSDIVGGLLLGTVLYLVALKMSDQILRKKTA